MGAREDMKNELNKQLLEQAAGGNDAANELRIGDKYRGERFAGNIPSLHDIRDIGAPTISRSQAFMETGIRKHQRNPDLERLGKAVDQTVACRGAVGLGAPADAI